VTKANCEDTATKKSLLLEGGNVKAKIAEWNLNCPKSLKEDMLKHKPAPK